MIGYMPGVTAHGIEIDIALYGRIRPCVFSRSFAGTGQAAEIVSSSREGQNRLDNMTPAALIRERHRALESAIHSVPTGPVYDLILSHGRKQIDRGLTLVFWADGYGRLYRVPKP